MQKQTIAIVALLTLAAAGCQTTGSDILSVPAAREYAELERVDLDSAKAKVDEARALGAAAYAPYEFFSAQQYLDIARQQKRVYNRRGAWDYAQLARTMAEAAIRAIPEEQRVPITVEPARDEQACNTKFEEIKARYLATDPATAKTAVPLLYAQATARLSLAEHNLVRGKDWREAATALVDAEALLDTMERRDTDGDGIVDLKDADPRQPEDFDGFEDEDGAPDPDNDQDGVPDVVDVAPLERETRNRWRDYDGAPDEYPEFEAIPFARGSATIDASTKGYLRGIARLLTECPEVLIHVKGYTDNSHSTRYSMDLSRRRAQRVQQYFIEQGIPPERLTVSFHGEADPVSDNDAEAGRTLNRRVQVVLE